MAKQRVCDRCGGVIQQIRSLYDDTTELWLPRVRLRGLHKQWQHYELCSTKCLKDLVQGLPD